MTIEKKINKMIVIQLNNTTYIQYIEQCTYVVNNKETMFQKKDNGLKVNFLLIEKELIYFASHYEENYESEEISNEQDENGAKCC